LALEPFHLLQHRVFPELRNGDAQVEIKCKALFEGRENVSTEHGRRFPNAAAAAATAAAAADANTAAYPGRLTHANLHGVEAVAAAAAAVVDAVWLTQQETAPAPHYASRSAPTGQLYAPRSGNMSETGAGTYTRPLFG